MPGPLEGVRVIEFANIGPIPFAGMLLADAGAEVIRIDRSDAVGNDPGLALSVVARGRRSIAVDLKDRRGIDLVLDLVERADVLFEGYRPGVMERLGLGPDQCRERNPGLVYGRLTGWGQSGPLAQQPGHDVNFLALAGALDSFRRDGEAPVPPLNLVGDFGGGSMFLVFGIVAALYERTRSGEGQVVDATMLDGVAAMTAQFHGARAAGEWGEPGTNALDTGSHFYEVYTTADGRHVGVGAYEPKFYANLLDGLGLDPADLPDQFDESSWPQMKDRFRELFAARTMAEWERVFDGVEACVAPVLTLDEAPQHPHNRERGTFVEHFGVAQGAPAPRFSRTASGEPMPPERAGQRSADTLKSWGIDPTVVKECCDERVVVTR